MTTPPGPSPAYGGWALTLRSGTKAPLGRPSSWAEERGCVQVTVSKAK